MAVWGILEIFKAPQLLCRVRTELENIGFHNVADDDDVEKLLAVPLLQSIYSELLRLRVEVQTIFFGNEEDFHINEWRIPRGSLVVVPAGDAHRDEDIWNTKGGQHPLNEFWSDRFLAYTGDPLSGPRNLARLRSDRSKPTPGPIQDEKPRFTSAGLTDTFMPFGIGERTCPGRGFARREIITICALVAHRYDIELVPRKHHFETTKAFYGIGTQRPKDKIPFKIRLRKQEK
ncbi:MAG: hypothetical protein L6R41_007892 [Letrouitia leprolyta]|nr:MAG: hypothetical protein L6R41_007892 [Letrouitia leprolyta]